MNIRKEIHCARMHRRFTFPLSISVEGNVYSLINWSEGGVLIAMPGHLMKKDQEVAAEVMIPCLDGVYSLPVRLRAVREDPRGWGCQFIDLPPREHAILKFFIEIVLRGDNVLMAELDAAGRIARNPDPAPPTKTETWQTKIFHLGPLHFPLKYLLLVATLLFVIGIIGYFVVPYLVENVWNKLRKAGNLEAVALSRVEAADLALRDLDNKIASIENLLAGGGNVIQGFSLRPEQRHALELGLSQLRTERELALVHRQIMQKNLDLIRRGDFLIEESIFAGYETDARLSQPPFLSEILTDIAVSSRTYPQTEEDRKKFERIADARLAQAKHNLRAATVKRQTLEAIVERSKKAAAASALPQNTLDIMIRDLELLRIEEQRLADIIGLLEENAKAVREGNFTYELQLLQKFDPRGELGAPGQPAVTTQ